jgi:hypothetical protein
MTHFEKIQTDMYGAMKSGEKEKANTLRSVISKLKDKQIEKRDTLTKEEEIKVLQTLVKQRKESIDLYQKGGRNELAEIESKEMDGIKHKTITGIFCVIFWLLKLIRPVHA